MNEQSSVKNVLSVGNERTFTIIVGSRIFNFQGTWSISAEPRPPEEASLPLQFDYLVSVSGHHYPVSPEDVSTLKQWMANARPGHESTLELCVVMGDGSRHRLMAQISPVIFPAVAEAGPAHQEQPVEMALLRHVEAITASGSWKLNLETRAIFFTDNLYRICGLPAGAPLSAWESLLRYVHPNDRAKVGELDNLMMHSGEEIALDFRIYRSNDGALRYLKGRTRFFASGNEQYCIGTVQDVTEKVRNEETLLRNYQVLKQTEDVASIGNWEFIPADNTFRWSEGMYKIFERTMNSPVVPEVYIEAVVPEDRRVAEKIVNHFRREPAAFEETIRIKPNEKVKTLRVKGTVIRNEKNEPVKIVGVDFDITALTDSEKAFAEQSYLIDHVVETIPDMISVLELGTMNMRYVNHLSFMQQGFAHDRMIDMSRNERQEAYIHPEDQEVMREYFRRFETLDDDTINMLEYRAQNDAGEWQWYRVRGKVFMRNAAGVPTHCVNVVQNINSQKVAELTVMEQSQYIQRLVDAIPDSILIFDFDENRVVYANPEVSRLFGYDTEEMLAMEFEVFEYCIHPADLVQHRSEITRLLEEPANIVFESIFRIVRKDGRMRNVHVRRTAFRRDHAGAVVQMVAIFRDITLVKQAEQENLHMKEMLARQAENKYKQLFNSIDEGFCIVEMIFDDHGNAVDYRFIETNPAFEKHTGLNHAAGKTMRELAPKHERAWFDTYGNVAKTGEALRFVQPAEFLGERWFEVYAFPAGERGSNRVAILFSDVTERRLNEQALRETNNKLLELDRAKTNFFNNVSHEFRTPLTLLLGPLEDVVKNGGSTLSKADADKLQMAHRNGLRLQKLVNTLLDFSRMEAGRMDAIYQPTDIVKFTSGLAGTFRSAIEMAGLKLVEDFEDPGEPVYLNRDMYEKIVLNLLSNALKFTFSGKIEVKIRPRKKRVELRVRDTGVGIASENLSRIFERFNRIEGTPSRTHEGSGIGLALVKELVAMHGGHISVKSERNKGSEFVVSFPRGKSHLPSKKIFDLRDNLTRATQATAFLEEAKGWMPSECSVPLPPSVSPEPKHSVLIADDNADMRAYLKNLLADRFEVIVAENGARVLELLEQDVQPDLLLLDVMMPEMDGYAILSTLRQHLHWQRIPVIMLSARAGEEAKVEGMRYRADDYIVKPFSSKELVARVDARIQIADMRNRTERLLLAMNQQLEGQVKRRTEELQESNDLLARQKELLQKTLDAIPQMIWVADATGKIKQFNNRWFTYTGLGEDLEDGQMITGFDVFHSSQREEILAQVTNCIRDVLPCHMEALVRNKQQEYRWHLHDIFPVFNRLGAVELWVGSFTDIAERKSTELHLQEVNESLAASNHELKSLNDELATFAFIASHDLREPLRKIQLFTLMLEQREENLSETGKDFFSRIMTSVQRMNELIDDILLYSQFTTGVSKFVNMNVAAALEEALSSLREKINQTSGEIVSSADAWMMADPVQVIQLLHNLVSNAIKFHRPEVKPKVTITATVVPGKSIDYPVAVPGIRYVQIQVTDNGIGFEQHYENKIFAMFQRLHSRKEYPGTGMGLAICRRIMENHKGFINVKSEPGNGSVFTCYFPQYPGKRT